MASQLRAGVVWANTFNRFDPDEPLRRLPRVGLRPRGRPPRAGGVPRCLKHASRCSKTYKLYIGGAFPRSESGRSYVVDAADGGFLANVA